MSYTRQQWAVLFLRGLSNYNPHQDTIDYVVAWTQFETTSSPGALNNLLNTTEEGWGCELLPEWNSVHVRQFPTVEDGAAACASSLVGHPIHYYPVINEALRSNVLAPLLQPTPEVVKEMSTWGTYHANDVALLAKDKSRLRPYETFTGRYAGNRY